MDKPPKEVEGITPKEFKSQILCDRGSVNFEYYFIDEKCFAQSAYITAWEELKPESGRVFWQNEHTYTEASVRTGRRHANVKTDLKWGDDTVLAEKYLEQFLTHAAFAAAWQGAGAINWFCSYPTAFSHEAQKWFRDDVLKRLFGGLSKESTGIEAKFDEKTGFVTESVAAARHFITKHPDEGLYLCVDIGGGTSDISVWYQKRAEFDYMFQSSVRFASGEMFVDPLLKLLNSDPAVLDDVLTQDSQDPIWRLNYFWGPTYVPSRGHSLLMKRGQLSAVLSEYAKEIEKRLRRHQRISPAFATYVTIAYSGLCFYLAHIIAALFKGRETAMPPGMVFGLSGRGALLTEWIDADAVHREMGKLIPKLVYGEKSGASFKITLAFSPEQKTGAKTETARGLLCKSIGGEKRPAEIYMGAGVSFEKKDRTGKGIPKSADDFVSREDSFVTSPADWTASFDSDLNSLKEFIEFFDEVVHNSSVDGYDNVNNIGLSWFKDNRAALQEKIDNAFGYTMSNALRFESPFIVALKGLLSIKYGGKELHF
jgi:hypothetical protein